MAVLGLEEFVEAFKGEILHQKAAFLLQLLGSEYIFSELLCKEARNSSCVEMGMVVEAGADPDLGSDTSHLCQTSASHSAQPEAFCPQPNTELAGDNWKRGVKAPQARPIPSSD